MYAGTNGQDVRRVISYARVSTGAQAASGLSVEAQHMSIAESAGTRGWEVAMQVTDEGISGMTSPERRPAMAAAISELECGNVDALMASHVDRLGRKTLDLLLLLERAEQREWELHALDAPVDVKTPNGRAMFEFLAVMASLEAGIARARTKAALRTVRQQGRSLGRPSRQPEEARVLAFQLHTAGFSQRQIAAALEAAGIFTATGKAIWHHSTIAKLLRDNSPGVSAR